MSSFTLVKVNISEGEEVSLRQLGLWPARRGIWYLGIWVFQTQHTTMETQFFTLTVNVKRFVLVEKKIIWQSLSFIHFCLRRFVSALHPQLYCCISSSFPKYKAGQRGHNLCLKSFHRWYLHHWALFVTTHVRMWDGKEVIPLSASEKTMLLLFFLLFFLFFEGVLLDVSL